MNLFAQTAEQGQVLGTNTSTLANTGTGTILTVVVGAALLVAVAYISLRKTTS